VNDRKVVEGRIERTQPMIFSADETADVGEDDATPVTEDYKAYDNKFTGKIVKVKVDVKEMGAGMKAEAAKAGAGIGFEMLDNSSASRFGGTFAQSMAKKAALEKRAGKKTSYLAAYRGDLAKAGGK
jgi:hypothetical protein